MIIDGFRTVRDARPSDVALSEFMLSLNSLVSTMQCTTFLLSPTEGNVADSENTLVDGLIELSQFEHGLATDPRNQGLQAARQQALAGPPCIRSG